MKFLYTRPMALVVLFLLVATRVLSGCGGGSSVLLTKIELSPTFLTIALGTNGSVKATGIYSDGTKKDLTKVVVWTSSQKSVAIVSKGTVTALAVGTTTITASDESIFSQIDITATAATLVSLDVTPVSQSIIAGTTQQFVATGTFSDASTQDITSSVTWDSSDTATAVISNDSLTIGIATGVAPGTTTITATSDLISASTVLTISSAALVSIDVSPHDITIANLTTQRYTAVGTYSDFSTQDITTAVTWTSSDITKATIDNTLGSEGLATAVAAGATTITATLGLITANTTLTVSSATLLSIDVEPSFTTIAAGTTRSFTATGTFSDETTQDLTASVVWSSTDTSKATISNGSGTEGIATAVAAGTTTISATLGLISGSTDLTVTSATLVSIEVSPAIPSIALGTTVQFYATGTFSDNSTQDLTTAITWSSSDTNIATIGNGSGSKGFVTSVAVGTTTITATSGLISSNTVLTITAATLESIDIAPANSSIALGTKQQFIATGTFSDTTTQDLTAEVAWSSSDTAKATISSAVGSAGLASSLAVGTTTITASLGIISGTTGLTVTPATLVSISVTPSNPSSPRGTQRQFTATGTFSDASTQDLTTQATWSSSDTSITTISNVSGSRGLANAISAGAATITASFSAVSGNTTFTVTAATLVSITVTPSNPSIAKGATRQFTATGTYSDASTLNITNAVTWSSSDNSKASISNSLGTNGLATGANVGSATITATLGAVSGNTSLTIVIGLDHVTISPTTSTLSKSTNRQLTGSAFFSDGSSLNVTNVTSRWKSSNNTIIKVNYTSIAGLIRAKKTSGSVTITFTYTQSGVTKSTTLIVTAIP